MDSSEDEPLPPGLENFKKMDDGIQYYNPEETNEFIKEYWKKKQGTSEAPILLESEDNEEKSSNQEDETLKQLFDFVEKTKKKKKLPCSHRSTNLKPLRELSPRSHEICHGGHESPPSVRTCHRPPKKRPLSQESFSSRGCHPFHHLKNFDLRSILSKKYSSKKYDCRKYDCQPETHKSSSSLEMDNAHNFSKSQPCVQKGSSNCCSHPSHHRKSYDSYSSSTSESYSRSSNHRRRHFHRRIHRFRLHRSPDSRSSSKESDYPQKHCDRYKRSHRSRTLGKLASSRFLDLNDEHRSSKSQPRAQSSSSKCRSHRKGYDLHNKSNSPQKYADCHKCHKRRRTSTLEHCSLSKSPTMDNAPTRSFKEDKAREDKREKTLKKCSAEIRKCPVDDDYKKRQIEELKKKAQELRNQCYVLPDSSDECNSPNKSPNVMDSSVAVSIERNPNKETEDLTKDHAKAKIEFQEQKEGMPNTFFCKLCQLTLNSEVTWSTHIIGKRHSKRVQLQTVYDIAKGSLPVSATPSIILEDGPRFADPPHGKKRRRTSNIARLQTTIDDITDKPVAGLEFVQEIISPMDVDYYCSLCDAPCKPSSIMPHLVGYKHQLRVVRELFPDYYDANKSRQDPRFKREMARKLLKYERKWGRGSIKVFREDDDPSTRPAYEQPWSNWRNPTAPNIKKEPNVEDTERSATAAYLDMSKGDFFCKLCDSHMNNVNMWEQHIRGRRHLENAKKIPGESISKMRSEKMYGAVSKLEKRINKEASNELIVGLDFIRETRGPAGEMYNCFLCGSCSTNYDILDHLLLLKHRTKYLERLNVEGKSNVIELIDQLELKENNYRESLINGECMKMLELYGPGEVEVYKSKN